MLTKVLLVIIYPVVLLAWLINRILRRDRLRLHSAPRGESLWIERRAQPMGPAWYFSEESFSEGSGLRSAARPLILLLCTVAALFGPRQKQQATYTPSADREQGIPDEVYTLW
jgi:hypothetical protein